MFHIVTFLPAPCFFDYSVLCCCFRLVSKKSSKDHPGSQTLTKSWRWSRASIHPSPWYIRRTSADPRDGTSATSASVASRHRCKRLRLLAAEVLAPPAVGTWPPQWKVPRINFMSPAYTLNVPRNSWVAVAEVYDVTCWSSLRWGPCTGSLDHSSWTIWKLCKRQFKIFNTIDSINNSTVRRCAFTLHPPEVLIWGADCSSRGKWSFFAIISCASGPQFKTPLHHASSEITRRNERVP